MKLTRALDFATLRERIGNHRVVLDENMMMSNLRAFLTNNNITWRAFRAGVTDEDIMRNLYPDEVVITADRRFAYALKERGILVPLAKSHLAQMNHLVDTIGKRVNGPTVWADISTCPICTVANQNESGQFTWWDLDHVSRHFKNPHITIGRRR